LRKLLLAVTITIILAVLTLVSIQYIHYAKNPSPDKTFLKPHLEIIGLTINSFNDKETKAQARLMFTNPLPVSFTAEQFHYNLRVSGKDILDNSYPPPIYVGAYDTVAIELPLTVETAKLSHVRKTAEIEKHDSLEYEFKASFHTNLPFKKDFYFDIRKTGPMLKIPEFRDVETELDSINLSGATLVFHTVVANRNAFNIEVSDLRYKAELGKHIKMDGLIPRVIIIPAGSQAPLDFPLRISYEKAGKALWEIITKGQSLEYSFELNLKLQTKNKSLNNCMVSLTHAGYVRSLIRLGKRIKKEKEKKDQKG
jgi:LEA14-like dessication related protein